MHRTSTGVEVHCGFNMNRNMESEKLRSAAACVSVLLTFKFTTVEHW